jgi:glycosyltransferase involved in cell wall biosynthesis
MTVPESSSSSPLISIGIPAYNSEDSIAATIATVQAQAYLNWELIISDDASQDRTGEICRQIAAQDPRVHYIPQTSNLGLAGNFEFCLQEAKGRYFMWLSNDDRLEPEVLEQYVAFLESHPEYALVMGKINYLDGEEIFAVEQGFSLEQASGLRRSLAYYQKVKQGAMLYGLYRTELGRRVRFRSILGNDWHFIAGLAYQGKLKQLPTVGYHKFAGGVSHSFRAYARTMGERSIWGYLPYVKMGLDAARELIYRGQVYHEESLAARWVTGIRAALTIMANYYLLIFPRMQAGKLLRLLRIKTPRERKLERELAHQES